MCKEMTRENIRLSIITPAFNEEGNLPLLHRRIQDVMEKTAIGWEWLIVDDSSRDATIKVIEEMAKRDAHIKGIRLAKNVGSHAAIKCGLDFCGGDCAVVMAADCQDPPETIPVFLNKWQGGAKIVWGVRSKRYGEKNTSRGFSHLYYLIMRKVVGIREIPATGADFFLIDRQIIEALTRFTETHVSLFALITWLGFQQEFITYDKDARHQGQSGWTMKKKLKLVADSVAAFSYFPIRFMSYLGFLIAVIGFIYAGVVFVNGLFGKPILGWASLMVVILVIGGMQMLMLGILGEYLWRALDEARRRPQYIIDSTIGEITHQKQPQRYV